MTDLLPLQHKSLEQKNEPNTTPHKGNTGRTAPVIQTQDCIETNLQHDLQQVVIEFTAQDLLEEEDTTARQNIRSPPPPSSTKNTRVSKNNSNNQNSSTTATTAETTTAAPLSFFDTDWLAHTFSREEIDPTEDALDDDDDAASQASASSRASSAYFDQTDFNSMIWMQAMDAPTFGLAVIALTTVITHPILFMAGAIAALGTATAVGASYDLLEGPLRRWMPCGDSTAVTVCGQTCTETSTQVDDVAEETVAITPTELVIKQYQDVADEATVESSTTEDPADVQESNRQQNHHHQGILSEATIITLDDALPDDCVDEYYPPLKNQVVQDVEMLGLNTVQFFRVFFANAAPYNFLEYQKKRGDIDITYGLWEDLTNEGPASLHPKATNRLPSDLGYHSFQERILKFRAKTNSFIGPMYATTTKHQRILIVSKRCAVIESRTYLADIPYCDRFTVMERWVIKAIKEDGHYTARISTYCQVFFTKSCPFEGQIRSKSASTVSEVVKGWCVMAQEALKLTEQAKKDRIRRSQTDDDDVVGDGPAESRDESPLPADHVATAADAEAIEVNHSYPHKRSCIVGEEETADLDQSEGITRSKSESNFVIAQRTSTLLSFRRTISQMVGKRRDSLPKRSRSTGRQLTEI
jgi:hypothetical protein